MEKTGNRFRCEVKEFATTHGKTGPRPDPGNETDDYYHPPEHGAR
jgi:hypothetical protein